MPTPCNRRDGYEIEKCSRIRNDCKMTRIKCEGFRRVPQYSTFFLNLRTETQKK